MTPARWLLVQRLFERALELEGDMRQRYLGGLQVRDRSLHAIVVDLLAADAEVARVESTLSDDKEILAVDLVRRGPRH